MPKGVSANSGKIAALRRLFRGIPKIVHVAETIETRENPAIVAEFSPSLAKLLWVWGHWQGITAPKPDWPA
jgi:hypothetical protein